MATITQTVPANNATNIPLTEPDLWFSFNEVVSLVDGGNTDLIIRRKSDGATLLTLDIDVNFYTDSYLGKSRYFYHGKIALPSDETVELYIPANTFVGVSAQVVVSFTTVVSDPATRPVQVFAWENNLGTSNPNDWDPHFTGLIESIYADHRPFYNNGNNPTIQNKADAYVAHLRTRMLELKAAGKPVTIRVWQQWTFIDPSPYMFSNHYDHYGPFEKPTANANVTAFYNLVVDGILEVLDTDNIDLKYVFFDNEGFGAFFQVPIADRVSTFEPLTDALSDATARFESYFGISSPFIGATGLGNFNQQPELTQLLREYLEQWEANVRGEIILEHWGRLTTKQSNYRDQIFKNGVLNDLGNIANYAETRMYNISSPPLYPIQTGASITTPEAQYTTTEQVFNRRRWKEWIRDLNTAIEIVAKGGEFIPWVGPPGYTGGNDWTFNSDQMPFEYLFFRMITGCLEALGVQRIFLWNTFTNPLDQISDEWADAYYGENRTVGYLIRNLTKIDQGADTITIGDFSVNYSDLFELTTLYYSRAESSVLEASQGWGTESDPLIISPGSEGDLQLSRMVSSLELVTGEEITTINSGPDPVGMPPEVSSLYPRNNAQRVPIPVESTTGTSDSDFTISVTLSEAITFGVSGGIYLKNDDAIISSVGIASLGISGNTLSWTNPTNMDSNVNYHILVDDGIVSSISSGVDWGGISSASTWTFKTYSDSSTGTLEYVPVRPMWLIPMYSGISSASNPFRLENWWNPDPNLDPADYESVDPDTGLKLYAETAQDAVLNLQERLEYGYVRGARAFFLDRPMGGDNVLVTGASWETIESTKRNLMASMLKDVSGGSFGESINIIPFFGSGISAGDDISGWSGPSDNQSGFLLGDDTTLERKAISDNIFNGWFISSGAAGIAIEHSDPENERGHFIGLSIDLHNQYGKYILGEALPSVDNPTDIPYALQADTEALGKIGWVGRHTYFNFRDYTARPYFNQPFPDSKIFVWFDENSYAGEEEELFNFYKNLGRYFITNDETIFQLALENYNMKTGSNADDGMGNNPNDDNHRLTNTPPSIPNISPNDPGVNIRTTTAYN